MSDDDDLRDAFRRLRAHDARNLPSFEALVKAPPRAPKAARGWLLVAPLVAAAAVLVAVCSLPRDAPVAFAPPAPAPPPSRPAPVPVRAFDAPSLPLDFLLARGAPEAYEATAFLSRIPDLDTAKVP